MSQENPIRLYVSHLFEPDDEYQRVFEYLESARNFYYRNLSAPDQPPRSFTCAKSAMPNMPMPMVGLVNWRRVVRALGLSAARGVQSPGAALPACPAAARPRCRG